MEKQETGVMMRKKLTDILEKAGKMREFPGSLARILIENGVTINEWISVKDRLPEDSTTVNLYTRGRAVGTGFYDKHTKSWVQIYSGGAICVDVTHWQPMPQPPKGE